MPSPVHALSACRCALADTACSRIHETTVLVSSAEPEDQVEVLQCDGPGVAGPSSMTAQEVGRYRSRHVQRSV